MNQTTVAPTKTGPKIPSSSVQSLAPAWWAFVRYCQELGHGEIQAVKIQDGLPVIAEVAIKKVKFGA